MKIAICDDDKLMCKKLVRLLNTYAILNKRKITIGVYDDGLKLIKVSNEYDLIFLDVVMPSINGLEVGSRIREENINTQIIFVTTHKSYMHQAFSVRAFGYVIKPFKIEDIFNELNSFVKYMDSKKDEKNIKDINLLIENENIITFNINKKEISINIDDIYYFEYTRNNGVKIVTLTDELYVRLSMKKILDMLQGYNFYSTHKSFIVNLLYINSIKDYDLVMENEVLIPIAQKKLKEFKSLYNRYLREM